MKDIVLITPPFTQLNTPYPATPYLKGFLNTINRSVYQADLGLEVILDIFCEEGLMKIFELADTYVLTNEVSENSKRILSLKKIT